MGELSLVEDFMLANLKSQLSIKEASLFAQERYSKTLRFRHEVIESSLTGLKAEIFEIKEQISEIQSKKR